MSATQAARQTVDAGPEQAQDGPADPSAGARTPGTSDGLSGATIRGVLPVDATNHTYAQFLAGKTQIASTTGFDVEPTDVHPLLKPHQRDTVAWAVRGGRRAVFANFGLGKTLIQLEIIRLTLARLGGGRGLIVLPLGVRQEFVRDARMLGLEVTFVRTAGEAAADGIYTTNYESVRDGRLDPNEFDVVSLDEAAVLRSYGSKTYQTFLPLFRDMPYRFVATATPSPNRYKELIHYAGFLGMMDTGQALTRFFQRDSSKAGNLTLYPHKEREFWLWVSSWALFLQRPSDLGYSDDGYLLPDLEVVYHEIEVDHSAAPVDRDGQAQLFRGGGPLGVSEAAREKRDTLAARVAKAAELVTASPGDHFILWHDPTSPLVLQPFRQILAHRPRWVALEQVEDVAPFWRELTRLLEDMAGYSTAVGVLSAETFGVPQTRRRAILVARLDGPASLPAPTHEAYTAGVPSGSTPAPLFGDPLLPWVSMLEALPELAVLGAEVDCASPFQEVPTFGTDRPARTLTCKARSWTIRPGVVETENRSETAAGHVPYVRPFDAPAPTVVGNEPAMTVAFGHSDMRWALRNNTQDNAARRDVDDPAPTLFFGARCNDVSWVAERPATAVCGDPRLAGPGHRDREGGQRQYDGQTVRVSVEQAGVLQSFPRDYPWQGTKTSRFRQVGDAVPPLLAAAVVGEIAGLPWRQILWGLEPAA